MQAIFFHALALFCSCLAVHVVVWRLFPVRRQGIRLGMIFVLMPGLSLALVIAASRVFRNGLPDVEWTIWGLAYVLHLSLSGSYMFLYTAVTGFSPSIAILERVKASMPQGLERNELAPKWFTDANLTGARRENLLATGFILASADFLRLSSRGWVIARCFLIFRRFLGLKDLGKG